MLPALTSTNLPKAQLLWEKISQDLARGFRTKGQYPYYSETVRVYTHLPGKKWRFLIVATANRSNPPVFSVEMHFYHPQNTTWKLRLIHMPIPQPQWQHKWEELENEFVVSSEVDPAVQKQLINHYLQSQVDEQQTADKTGPSVTARPTMDSGWKRSRI